MTIEVNNESAIPTDEKALSDLARFVLGDLNIHPSAELAILLVNADVMEQLHLTWMDEPGPTDVLSFPMDELRPGTNESMSDPGILGDVVLCPQVAAEQAKKARHDVEYELSLLTTHGILHLLGYDHAEPDEEKQMFSLQKRLLDDWYTARGEG